MTSTSPPNPRVFLSYSHDSDEHRKLVLGLSERLRQDGIDAVIDQYVQGTPSQGWPRWMLDQLDRASFVLVVCTEINYRRFRGHVEPGKGKGADWEGALITQKIYDSKSRTTKFVPVLFDPGDEPYIPEPLRNQTHYLATREDHYETLYDVLLGQGGIEPGKLGTPRLKGMAARQKGPPMPFGRDLAGVQSRDRHEPDVASSSQDGAHKRGTEKLVSDGTSADPVMPLHWNTRLLDGVTRVADLMVTVGHPYALETGIDRALADDAIVSAAIAADLLVDGKQVTFVVSGSQSILRTSSGELADRVEGSSTYDTAAGRCPPVRFELRPVAPGPIMLALSLVTDNAIRASSRITLLARPAAGRPERASATPGTADPIAVAVAALAGPPAELRVELTPTNQIVVSTGAKQERPRPLATAQSVLAGAAIRARAELVRLSQSYNAAPGSRFGIVDAPAVRLAMARIGATLHEAFFGHPDDNSIDADLKRLARLIAATPRAGSIGRLQIGAAYQPFPWAIMYDGVYRGRPLSDDDASVDLTCFWGNRLRIDRAIIGHVDAPRSPLISGGVRVQACLNPHLDDEQAHRGVCVLEAQKMLFNDLPGVIPYPIIDNGEAFKEYVTSQKSGPCDLLYVFCHATAAHTRDDLFTFTNDAPDTQAKLIFDLTPAPPVDVATLKTLRRSPLEDRPLVFLNACSSASGDEAFQGQFLEQFLDRWQAVGLLGTDWEVPTVFAHSFAQQLIGYFLRDHLPLGEAFARASRDAFGEGNPFPLVYALYASPELTTVA